jgi:hypothetical protein
MGRPVEIEVERQPACRRVRAHDRMRDRGQYLRWTTRRFARREGPFIVVGVDDAQAAQALFLLGCKQVVRSAQIEKYRIAAAARRERPRVEHRSRRRLLDVTVVDVKGLEQAGTLVVEPAKRQCAQLLPDLIRHDEARVDDLPVRTVLE